MFSQFGLKVRTIRMRKGIGLNAFAAQLGISPAYLSNLETGKTETIHLELLEQLQNHLQLISNADEQHLITEYDFRIQRATSMLKILFSTSPETGDYLLSTLENGLDLLGSNSDDHSMC